eukprot:3408066-Amphidinium_carterae.2
MALVPTLIFGLLWQLVAATDPDALASSTCGSVEAQPASSTSLLQLGMASDTRTAVDTVFAFVAMQGYVNAQSTLAAVQSLSSLGKFTGHVVMLTDQPDCLLTTMSAGTPSSSMTLLDKGQRTRHWDHPQQPIPPSRQKLCWHWLGFYLSSPLHTFAALWDGVVGWQLEQLGRRTAADRAESCWARSLTRSRCACCQSATSRGSAGIRAAEDLCLGRSPPRRAGAKASHLC